MKKINDGWHVVKGFDVYVEDGRVVRGVRAMVSAYPYRLTKNGWEIGKPLVSTFRNSNWTLK